MATAKTNRALAGNTESLLSRAFGQKGVAMTCPACNGKRHEVVSGRVYKCTRCGALHGTCYLGDSHALVLPQWHEGESKPEDERYYDFECLGSKGITRRHGWYNVKTRRITQTG